jgi:hypothetical protein
LSVLREDEVVTEFVWRGQNTGELLEFLDGIHVSEVSFWLRFLVGAQVPCTIYRSGGHVATSADALPVRDTPRTN